MGRTEVDEKQKSFWVKLSTLPGTVTSSDKLIALANSLDLAEATHHP
jgi:hypothetical protein